MLTQNINKNIVIINYSNSRYEKTRKAQSMLIRQMGFNLREYSDKDLPESFKNENKNILDKEIGGGYWLWKPYIILDSLEQASEEQIIFYLDSGDIIDPGLSWYLEEHFKYFDYILYEGAKSNEVYTKPEVFKELNLGEEYKKVIQLEAGICGFKKTKENIEFIKEWLDLCKNEKLVLDDRYDLNLPSDYFVEHRRDQSLLTILKVKYGRGAIPLNQRMFIDCNKENILNSL